MIFVLSPDTSFAAKGNVTKRDWAKLLNYYRAIYYDCLKKPHHKKTLGFLCQNVVFGPLQDENSASSDASSVSTGIDWEHEREFVSTASPSGPEPWGDDPFLVSAPLPERSTTPNPFLPPYTMPDLAESWRPVQDQPPKIQPTTRGKKKPAPTQPPNPIVQPAISVEGPLVQMTKGKARATTVRAQVAGGGDAITAIPPKGGNKQRPSDKIPRAPTRKPKIKSIIRGATIVVENPQTPAPTKHITFLSPLTPMTPDKDNNNHETNNNDPNGNNKGEIEGPSKPFKRALW